MSICLALGGEDVAVYILVLSQLAVYIHSLTFPAHLCLPLIYVSRSLP